MSLDFEDTLLSVANMMALSAKTAPKAKGIDNISIKIIKGEEKDKLADKMIELSSRENKGFFKRDAESVKRSSIVLLIGVKGGEPLKMDCRGCGFKSCNDFLKSVRIEGEYKGPNCIFKLIDLGIAIGSAVKMASILNVDNRVMYSVGVAAREMGYIDGDVVLGIPLAAYGKNPFFDRKK
ncbi:MAG: ferredoxin domain-containing protein [Candidatus Asgardarchaeia archaeon]